MTVGNKIQELRKNKSLSQEAFAEMMGVTRQSVSKWELDQSYPAIDKLVEIADFFGISLDELLREQNGSTDPEESSLQAANDRNSDKCGKADSADKITVSKEYVWYFFGWAVMAIIVIILNGVKEYFAGFLITQVFIWTTVILKVAGYVKKRRKKTI